MKNSKTIIIIAAVLIIAVGVAAVVLSRDNKNLSDDIDNANVSNSDNVNNNNETGGSEKQEDTPREKEGYFFEYNGVQIGINDEAAPILEVLGEPMHYFEAPSCAFEGMDKIYSYSGFEFTTYTKDNVDYIASIVFLDDTVTTREGITLNATLEDIVAAYGSEYENSFNQYSYRDGNCVLSVIIENDEVVSVEYALPEDDLEG
jgi:hypothetical protein